MTTASWHLGSPSSYVGVEVASPMLPTALAPGPFLLDSLLGTCNKCYDFLQDHLGLVGQLFLLGEWTEVWLSSIIFVAPRKRIQLVSMGMRVRSMLSLSGLEI